MRKNSRKISLAILALTAVSLGAVATGNLSLRTAAAEINTLDTFRLENVSVRLKLPDEQTNGGFRFESLISQDTYDGLTNVTEVGTLFTITDMSEDSLVMGASNVAKIVLEGTVGEENRRGGEKTTDDEGVAVISYRAFINDIPDTAFDTDVMARSYVIADGVTYYTNVVTQSVGDVARDAYYDVQQATDDDHTETVQDGWYSPFTASQHAEIGEYITTSEKTYEDQYVLVENGNATLDLSQLSISGNDVIGCMVDGKFTSKTLTDSALTYATTVGEKTLTVATTEGVYDIALVQADNVIDTAAKYTAWMSKQDGNFATGTYTVLANDIDCSALGGIEAGKFYNTFNGLGHTVTGLNCNSHGIVQQIYGGAIWKNVNYVGLTLNGDQGLFGYFQGAATIDNVNVFGTAGTNCIFVYGLNNHGTVISNSTFTFTSANNPDLYLYKGTTHHYVLTLINTTVNYTGNIITTCDCGCGANAKLTLTESEINENYGGTTNYYAKVNGGIATFEISQMGDAAFTSVSKLLVNGVETTATVANGNLTYPASNTGTTLLELTTDKGTRVMNIVHADNVLTTWNEFNTWVTSTSEYNKYEYTVLASNITASGTTYSNGGHFAKTFDGLGHTIDKFSCGHGIVQRLLTGATWKNVNYTNLTAGDQGLFGYLAGGTFENITISGTLTSDRILAYGINNSDTKFINCTFILNSVDKKAVDLSKGEMHYYTITFVDSTIIYNGKVNYTTCSCGGSECTNTTNFVLTNSVVKDNVDTNYYAKVNGGIATFEISQMGDAAFTSVNKLLVNGVETTATVANGVLSYPATNTGTTLLELTTDKGVVIMFIAHADNVITSWEEYAAWGKLSYDAMNAYKYTVLADDITYSGTTAFDFEGNCKSTFDGLGHTIDGLIATYGIIRGLETGGVWKNVNYTNFKQTVGSWGILSARLRGGMFANVNIQGSFTVSGNVFLATSIEAKGTVVRNCTFTITDANNNSRTIAGSGTGSNTATLINTTINYSGAINESGSTNVTLTNSTINSKYQG